MWDERAPVGLEIMTFCGWRRSHAVILFKSLFCGNMVKYDRCHVGGWKTTRDTCIWSLNGSMCLKCVASKKRKKLDGQYVCIGSKSPAAFSSCSIELVKADDSATGSS